MRRAGVQRREQPVHQFLLGHDTCLHAYMKANKA
jgi:hypothetical protein